MLFAQQNPGLVKTIVTLDNLRVPFPLSKHFRTLSFRSKDWKADPGVIPNEAQDEGAEIEIVQTEAQHVEMSDRGPNRVKLGIEKSITRFLNEEGASEHPSTTIPGA